MLPRRERNHQPWRDAGASLRTALALETLVHLVAGIDANRQHADLSSAIRLHVLEFYRDQHQQHRALLDPSIRQSPTFNGFGPP
jgi:hypothetical protein